MLSKSNQNFFLTNNSVIYRKEEKQLKIYDPTYSHICYSKILTAIEHLLHLTYMRNLSCMLEITIVYVEPQLLTQNNNARR